MSNATKQCIRCHIEKDIELFKTKKKVRKRTGLVVYEVQGICKLCHNRLYHRQKYPGELTDPSGVLVGKKRVAKPSTATERLQKSQSRNKQYVKELLLQSKCLDCGINDWRLLEFDHLPEHTKSKNISQMYHVSLELLSAEIAKCEIVCCNCHRLRSFKRAGSWRLECWFMCMS